MKTDPFNGFLITMSEQKIKALKENNTPIPENLKQSYDLITDRQQKGEEYLASVGLSGPPDQKGKRLSDLSLTIRL